MTPPRTARITRLVVALGATAFTLSAVGCVSKEDYTALKMDRDTLAETLADARGEAEANGKLAEGYKQQLAPRRQRPDRRRRHDRQLPEPDRQPHQPSATA